MYLKRANEAFLFDSFERPYISALLGPRRVGKTTLVENYIKTHPERKWAVLNMDIRTERLRIANEELALMIEEIALQPLGGEAKIWVVIDEAQKCPELFDQIKIIYDAHKDKDKVKFILTGSAHLNLHQLTTESLAGRVHLLHLREFNLKEIAQLLHQDIAVPTSSIFDSIFYSIDILQLEALHLNHKPFNKILSSALETELIWGGLPEALQEKDDKHRLQYLGDYLQTYLEKDIRDIDTISDLSLFHNLMQICAEQTGSLHDDTKILHALHSSRNTIQKYRGYLQATLQYTEIYPYIDSTLKRLVKSPKGYITNNGLISYLTGIQDYAILKATGLLGHRFENWFLTELQTWLDNSVQQHQIYFWRTSSGVEVDFVVIHGNQVLPFEVTYSSQIQHHKVKHLKYFMQSESKATMGIYIYTGEFKFDAENKILFLPAWMV